MASRTVGNPPALSGTLGEMISEFFGTMVLILFGDGVVASFGLFGSVGPFATEWIVIIIGWGLAVMLGIYVAGAISGAHINPAVTLAFAIRGKHPWNKVLPYWGAQVAGAFVAALILYFVYQGAINNAIGGGDIIAPREREGEPLYTYPTPLLGSVA